MRIRVSLEATGPYYQFDELAPGCLYTANDTINCGLEIPDTLLCIVDNDIVSVVDLRDGRVIGNPEEWKYRLIKSDLVIQNKNSILMNNPSKHPQP